jgi:hypothetical protein
VRIRGGTARAYYVGVEVAAPAVPGMPAPVKALCVAPFGMEEGTSAPGRVRPGRGRAGDVPPPRLGVRGDDRTAPSSRLEDDLEADRWRRRRSPRRAAAAGAAGGAVAIARSFPVRLVSRVTEIGTLEIWCVSRAESDRRWKLEFNVREHAMEQQG